MSGAARRFSEERFGGGLLVREANVEVNRSQVVAVVGDPDRVGLFITNIGSTNITLSFESPIVAGEGFLLIGNGSTYSSTVENDGDSVALRLLGVSDVFGGLLRVVEFSRSP